MITSSIILIGVYIVNVILSVFPTSTGFPAEVGNSVAFIGGYVGILDPLVPLGTLSYIIGLIIAFELIIFAFKGAKWIFSHIPFIGGRGN